jgi:hypothetical protein
VTAESSRLARRPKESSFPSKLRTLTCRSSERRLNKLVIDGVIVESPGSSPHMLDDYPIAPRFTIIVDLVGIVLHLSLVAWEAADSDFMSLGLERDSDSVEDFVDELQVEAVDSCFANAGIDGAATGPSDLVVAESSRTVIFAPVVNVERAIENIFDDALKDFGRQFRNT